MEVFTAVAGFLDVAIRTGSKLWKLSNAWRDAPENLHRLRDDITRTHHLFAEIKENVGAQTRPVVVSTTTTGPSSTRQVDLNQVLGQGVAVLKQIEAVVEKLDKGEHPGKPGEKPPPQPLELGKRRKLVWLKNEPKVSALRKELRRIISVVANALIPENVRVSTETNTILKTWQNNLQSQIGDQLQTTSERIVSDTDGIIQRSETMISSRVSEVFDSSRDMMLEHMDDRIEHLTGDIVAAVRQSVTDEMTLHLRRLTNVNDQQGQQATEISSSAAWASFTRHVVPPNSTALSSDVLLTDETCHCRRQLTTSSFLWSSTLLQSVMGSITVVYSIAILRDIATTINLNGSPQMNIRVSNHLSAVEVPFSSDIFICIAAGDTEGVKKMLSEGRASVHDVYDAPRNTPLWNAMILGKTDIVRVLLQAGADPYHFNPFYKASPMSAVAMRLFSGSATAMEMASLFPISDYLEDQNYSTLHLAVGGILQLDLASLLCQPRHMSEINQRTGDGKSPLLIAAARGDNYVVRLLLEAGASTELREPDGMTALHEACYFGHYEVAQSLLIAGIGVNDKDIIGMTALQYAARGHQDDTQNLLSLLFQYGADVNACLVDYAGPTALLSAIEFGTTETIQFLISQGADINCVVYGYFTALLLAVIYNNLATINILLEHGAEVHHLNEFDVNQTLRYIATYGDYKTTEIFTTRKIKGIDPFRKAIPPGKTPQQHFDERNPTPELRRAFGRLIKSLASNYEGSDDQHGSFANAPDTDSSDDEFVDAEEQLGQEC